MARIITYPYRQSNDKYQVITKERVLTGIYGGHYEYDVEERVLVWKYARKVKEARKVTMKGN